MNASEMIKRLKSEKVNTWFDLGLFLDKVKENRKMPQVKPYRSYEDFKEHIRGGGMAFISFFYSVDGASMECDKYVRAFLSNLGKLDVHYISGKFYETGYQFMVPKSKKLQLDELLSFDDWDLYNDFFYNKLERGGEVYNRLIKKFWKQVITIATKLGRYFEENNIRLLYLLNINSNPGNVSEALALVLISEFMGIPVINNNHDFYWEGGNNETERLVNGMKAGPRDHFFKNYHLGEVFSLLEIIYPWESRSWLSLNINQSQSDDLIDEHGHNPANVMTIDTCIDTGRFDEPLKASRKKEILNQLNFIFRNTKKQFEVSAVAEFNKKDHLRRDKLRPMMLGAKQGTKNIFDADPIILLQPTRILRRKTINVDFTLIEKLLKDADVEEQFEQNEKQNIILLVTGPVATGQIDYFYSLVDDFTRSLENINSRFRKRIFLGFIFSEFDRESFKKNVSKPVTLPDLYKIASLVLLPSETEGRGLPIIEAAASGMPVFCRRYYPEHVFSHVIGENLPKSQRLSVTAFSDDSLDSETIESVKQQLFAPKAYAEINRRNQQIVAQRFSFENFANSLDTALYKLYLQLCSGPSEMEWAATALTDYANHIGKNKPFANNLIDTSNRQYLPGYGQMLFMLMLKSLIDPSYFRVEEKRIRGIAMQFARELVEGTPDPSPLALETTYKFYNSVDSLFLYHKDEMQIRIDHSLAYRHRNKIHFPYREFTPQELTGVINTLYHLFTEPPPVINIGGITEIKKDWHQNLAMLYDNVKLGIDHIDDLEERLTSKAPFALFPGKYIELELELFILAPLRNRLNLAPNEKIDETTIHRKKLPPIYIIQHEHALGNSVTADVLKSYVFYSKNEELLTIFRHGLCKILSSKQRSVGLHFYEIGEAAANALKDIKAGNGFIISTGDHATMMTDIVDIDRFHIGRVCNVFAAKILGIDMGSGYVQWVPAGLRFSLAFPTPVQTGKDLSKALKGFRFQRLAADMGRKKLLNLLRNDAAENGSPVRQVLKGLEKGKKSKTAVSYSSVNGLYDDGMPWSGVLARVSINKSKWNFSVISTNDKPKTVVQFVEAFNQEKETDVRVAWNGGYILNPELVGKLGIPETFIGSPLGLIISEGYVKCPPLFNKAAFVVQPDGKLCVKRVNSKQGLTVSGDKETITFKAEHYNCSNPGDEPCYYDLLYEGTELPGNGRVLVRLAGNSIKDILHTKIKENVAVLPVGLTLSFPKNKFPASWKVGQQLNIEMNGWEKIVSAIEAGPQLLDEGEVCLDMEIEGWKTQNSINTQAARLDFTDMRGPKIAIGIDAKGDLYILTVNGRIRESVGATHFDMAEILKNKGMVQAMGFDPGGSSTLVVDGRTLNISPYNSAYEKDVYALPPEPRAVANALLVW